MAIKFPIWGVKQSADGHKLEKLAPGVIGHEAVNVSQLKPNKGSAINIADNTAVPPTEVTGDIYILDFTTGGVNAAWDGASAGDVVEFDGALWQSATPTDGDAYVLSATDNVATYIDNPSPQWTEGENLSATYISDYFVSADHGDDANTGLSELNAFATLGAALDAGEAGGVPFAVHLLDDSTYEVTEDSGTPGVRTTATSFIIIGNSSTLAGQAGGVTWKTNSERIDGMNVDGANLTFGLTGTGAGGQIDHLHRWFKIQDPETLYKVEAGDGSPHRYAIYFNRCKGTGSFADMTGNSGQFAFMHIIGNDMGLDFNSGVTEYAFIGSGNQVIYNINITQLDVTNPGAGDAKPFDLKNDARAFARFNCVGAPEGADVDTGAKLYINAVTGSGAPLTYNDNGGAGSVYDASMVEGFNFDGLDADTGLALTDLVNVRDVSANKQVKATLSDLQALIGGFLKTTITPPTITVDTNDYSPTGFLPGVYLRASSSGGNDITGFDSSSFSDRDTFVFMNVGTGTIRLKPNDANSAAGNRMKLKGNLPLQEDESAIFVFDATDGCWRIISIYEV